MRGADPADPMPRRERDFRKELGEPVLLISSR